MGPLPTQSASIYPWKRVLPTLDVSYHATKLGFDALRGKDWWLVSFKADKPAGINLVLYLQTIRVTIDIAEIFRIGRVVLRDGVNKLWLLFYQCSRLSVMACGVGT